MIGNDLLLHRIMREHHERLLNEAAARRRVPRPADAPPGGALRALVGHSGDLLVAVGHRLQAVAPHAAGARRAAR